MAKIPVIPPFQAGFRLIDGSALNKLVQALNGYLGFGLAVPNALNVAMGTGTGTFQPDGAASINVTVTASGTATVTQNIETYILPANSLSAATNTLYVQAWGTYAGNANSKNVGLAIGGKSAFVGAGTTSGTAWVLNGQVSLTGAKAETLLFQSQLGATISAPVITTDTSDNTAAITIAVQGVTTSGTSSDILVDGLIVNYAP